MKGSLRRVLVATVLLLATSLALATVASAGPSSSAGKRPTVAPRCCDDCMGPGMAMNRRASIDRFVGNASQRVGRLKGKGVLIRLMGCGGPANGSPPYPCTPEHEYDNWFNPYDGQWYKCGYDVRDGRWKWLPQPEWGYLRGHSCGSHGCQRVHSKASH